MKTGQASHTAVVVAAGLQLLRHDAAYRSLLPSDAAGQGAALLNAVRPRLAYCLQWHWFRRACHALEQAIQPGILLHYALRKRALMQHARDSVRAGVTQVVVLGAGLDTISTRLLAEFPGLHCIEVDHPATQAIKQRALRLSGLRTSGMDGDMANPGTSGQLAQSAQPAQSGLSVPSVPCYVALDLAQQDLASALTACTGFDAARPTLFIVEGVLMYLQESKVGNLLRQLQAIAPQNWLAFTWFDTAAGFEVHSRWLERWLALRNEPFLSGMPRTILPRFLQRYGYVSLDVSESAAQLAPDEVERLARHGRVLRGEYICLAQSRHSTS